jgi:hypothetical protein
MPLPRRRRATPNDGIIYADSGKVTVRLARAIFRQAATMEYWDGED